MRSEILKIAAIHLKYVLLILSLLVLARGHNHPGGGFIGGLLAGSAFVLYGMAFGAEQAKKQRLVKPFFSIALGLLLSLGSGLIALVFKPSAFLEGIWVTVPLPWQASLKLGTPLLFDAGVFLVVAGMLVLVMLSIMEEG
jgi:multicomponent Na+:H+ antiporter subunit B